MNKAVFLDRDGVLNREIGDYVTRPSDFEVLDHAIPNLKKLYDSGFLLIIVTNQGGIAKGLYSKDELAIMHMKLIQTLKKINVHLTEIFYCPHHPDFSKCLCRKPNSLMIEKALAKYRIDPNRSFLIGDRPRDMEAATSAGVRGLLVNSNENISRVVNEILG